MIVRNKKQRSACFTKLTNSLKAFMLKVCVTNRQGFIHNKQIIIIATVVLRSKKLSEPTCHSCEGVSFFTGSKFFEGLVGDMKNFIKSRVKGRLWYHKHALTTKQSRAEKWELLTKSIPHLGMEISIIFCCC